MGQPYTEDQLAVIRQMRADRKTLEEISKTVGLSVNTVFLICKVLKIKKPKALPLGPSEYTRKMTEKIKGREETILRLYNLGWTYEAIGQELGITRERVRQILKCRGIKGVNPFRVSEAKQRERDRIYRVKIARQLRKILEDGGYRHCRCGCQQWVNKAEMSVTGLSYKCISNRQIKLRGPAKYLGSWRNSTVRQRWIQQLREAGIKRRKPHIV